MIIGLLMRVVMFQKSLQLHHPLCVCRSLCPFLRSLGIERTKTDRKDEGEQACRQDRAR